MTETTPLKWVYVVYIPYSEVHMGPYIRGVYLSMEAASYAAHECMDGRFKQEKDQAIIERHPLIDEVTALKELRRRQSVTNHDETKLVDQEEQEKIEEAQEILNEESTKSEADGTPSCFEEGDLTA